jgi:hypothetical protein
MNDLTWYFTLKIFVFEPRNGVLNYLFLRKFSPGKLKSGTRQDLACALLCEKCGWWRKEIGSTSSLSSNKRTRILHVRVLYLQYDSTNNCVYTADFVTKCSQNFLNSWVIPYGSSMITLLHLEVTLIAQAYEVRKELLCGCYSAFNIYSAKKISVR